MKKPVLLAFFSMVTCIATAQFSHRLGATYFAVSSTEFSAAGGAGITYFPRYSFNALSIGMPLSLALNSASSSRGESGISFTYHIPLVVDYNFGLAATPDDNEESGFGGYLGTGIGFFSTQYAGSFGSGSLSAIGPIARGGVRFMVKEHIYDLGLMYSMNLGKPKANIIGLSIYYTF